MFKLKFNIYIGKQMVAGQTEQVNAIVEPKFFIPKGRCTLDGTPRIDSGLQCFNRIYDAGTSITDWFDFVEDINAIQATIYLNKLSIYKTFNGRDITACIDKINNLHNYFEIKSFNELI